MKAGGFYISMVSDISMARDTIDKILNFIKSRVNLGEDTQYHIKLILNELLLNAIIHGNRCNRDKSVDIKLDISEDGEMMLEIDDQGAGFDYSNYRYRHPSTNPQQEHGRGLNIVHGLSDEVRYNKRGNRVTVIKTLSD